MDPSKTVPEFMYDLLARIIPGAFLVGPFFVAHNNMIDGLGTIGLGFGVLICAYVFGFLIELLSSRLLEWPYNRLNRWCRGYSPSADSKNNRFFEKRAPTDSCLWPRAGIESTQGRYFKMLAELGLFRSLLLICLVHAAFLSLPSCSLPSWLWYYQTSPIKTEWPLLGAALCAYAFDTVHLIITTLWTSTGKTRK